VNQQIQKQQSKPSAIAPIGNAEALAQLVMSAEQQLSAAAGTKVNPEKVAQLAVLTRLAAQRNPDLLKCTRDSLFWAFLDAQRCGLLWDGEQGALVPFREKVKGTETWTTAAKFIPMYRGLIHLLVDTGAIDDVNASLVYKGEHFREIRGTIPRLEHEPSGDVDRSDENIVAAYVVFTLPSGAVKFDVMYRDRLEKVRASSRAKDSGPWRDWFGEMCLKTVIKHGQKTIPRVPPKARAAVEIDTRYDTGLPSPAEEEARFLPPSGASGADVAAQRGLAGLKAQMAPKEEPPPPDPTSEPASGFVISAIKSALEGRKVAWGDALKAAGLPTTLVLDDLTEEQAATMVGWIDATEPA
jgi:phage RecT family recombinase